MSFQPLINGTAYSWSQITFSMFNVPVAGVKSISYNDEQEMQDNFGAGNRPVSRGYGRITCTGSIGLFMEEVKALQNASPTGRLQDIPEFDMVVSWLPTGGILMTHTLKNVKFKTTPIEVNEGDMEVVVNVDLQISHIVYK